MQRKLTNQTVTTAVAKVTPNAAWDVAMKAADVASKANVSFIASCTAYVIIACHLQEEKNRKTVKAARAELERRVTSEKGVGNEMLKRYLQVTFKAYTKLTDAGKYPAVVQRIANATEATQPAEIVMSYFTDTLGATSLNTLRRKLGISTGHETAEAKPVEERVSTSISNAVKSLGDKEEFTPAQRARALPKVAAAIVGATPADALVDVIRNALDKLSKLDSVSPKVIADIATMAAETAKTVEARAKVRAQAEKASVKTVVAAKAVKGKGKPARVTAH